MTADLLPCPFCGGSAERIDFGPGSGDNEGGSCIACTKCQSSGPVEFGYKENFVSNWNRRALSHAAWQEAVAPDEVYIREAAGTYTLCDLQETTFDDVPLYCARKASALTPAQPPASAEGDDSSEGAQCGGFRTKHGEHFDILYQAFTYASATDAKRLDWLAHHGASLRNDCQAEGGGWFVIAPYHTGISSVDGRARFATARAAIDAAMEGNE